MTIFFWVIGLIGLGVVVYVYFLTKWIDEFNDEESGV